MLRRRNGRPRAARRALPTYYGWRIVGFASITLMLTGPGQTIGMSVFVEELVVELDITRSRISFAYLIATLAGAFTLSWFGRSLDRFGIRTAMTGISIAFAIAIASLAGVVGFVSMVAAFTGLRALGQGALALTATTSVSLWFEQRRGMAVGIVTAVGAGLTALVPILFTLVIDLVGWRSALLLTAPLVGFLLVLIAQRGMRDGPHEFGLGLDGRTLSPQESASAQNSESTPARGGAGPTQVSGRSGREALRTPMFWALALVFATPSMIGTGLIFHQLSVLGEQGLTATQAAAMFLPYSLVVMAATFLTGALTDRIGSRALLALPMLTLMGAMQLVSHITPGALVLLYAVLLGSTSGAARALEPALMPKFFGLAHIGEIRGRIGSIKVGASALGPFALALGFDQFGAYGTALSVLMVLPAAGLLAVLVVGRPAPASAA